jgi:dTMP kinase
VTESHAGCLITFEGIDGSGKTTQIRRLEKELTREGLKPLVSREPGGTPLGEEIREILLAQTPAISPLSELFLFVSDRAQHIDQVIRPALQSGRIVLIDRFTDATVAYQGFGMGHPLSLLDMLHRAVLGPIRPKRTFLFDLPLESARERLRRRHGTETRFEKRGPAFFENVRRGYLEIAAQEPERFVVLDATLSEEELAIRILLELRPLLAAMAGKEDPRK